MTLDSFKDEAENILSEIKRRMTILLENGVASKLDEEIMLAIINRQISKFQEND